MNRKRIALLLLLILALGLCGFALWFYKELRSPFAHNRTQEYIEIPRGSSPTEIIGKLAAEGVIRRRWPLLVYIKLKGAGARLKAGEYRFASPISPLDVLRKLEEGEERLSRFTIIEGWTRWDIAAAMARIPETKLDSPEEALALMNDVSLIRDLDPLATNLEGYLYPDTYNFPPNSTPSQMIEMMVKRFRREWKPEWTERARQMKMTPREVVTIA